MKGSIQADISSPSLRKLVEEIQELRIVMEESYLQCGSLTNETVLHNSQVLDQKLNEYDRLRKEASL